MDSKAGAREKLQSIQDDLLDLSHRIHAKPEIGFEEEHAAAWLCDFLDGAGFTVERGICDLPTAFRAKAGNGPLHVAICAEYDSLPGIGHACGHNIIAASSCGAAIAGAQVADEAGLTVHLIGTPAEEVGNASGKILLLERSAFQGMHLAMMVHPAPFDVLTMKIIAASMFEVAYTGKESHASAFPELGINAADALTVAQTAIGLLRQHIRPTDRIHGIVPRAAMLRTSFRRIRARSTSYVRKASRNWTICAERSIAASKQAQLLPVPRWPFSAAINPTPR